MEVAIVYAAYLRCYQVKLNNLMLKTRPEQLLVRITTFRMII
jgi:hypothetical protein